MEENLKIVGVGVDHGNKVIAFMENFDYRKAQEYIKVCKMLVLKIGEIIEDYTVTFKNRKFKNVIDLGKGCAMAYDKEINKLLNPKLDTKTLKALGILNVDLTGKSIEVDPAISKPTVVRLICSIPTLIPFSIKYGDRMYRNVSSMAKDEFKDYKKTDIIHLTNEFAKDTLIAIQLKGDD